MCLYEGRKLGERPVVTLCHAVLCPLQAQCSLLLKFILSPEGRTEEWISPCSHFKVCCCKLLSEHTHARWQRERERERVSLGVPVKEYFVVRLHSVVWLTQSVTDLCLEIVLHSNSKHSFHFVFVVVSFPLVLFMCYDDDLVDFCGNRRCDGTTRRWWYWWCRQSERDHRTTQGRIRHRDGWVFFFFYLLYLFALYKEFQTIKTVNSNKV